MNPQPFTIRLCGRITDVERPIHGTASQLAEAGAQLACDFASTLTGTEWKMIALAFLRGFAKYRGTFQCSQVREESAGVVPAHPAMDQRAWGSVFQAAHREGWIKPLGYATTERKTSHGRAERVWQYCGQ